MSSAFGPVVAADYFAKCRLTTAASASDGVAAAAGAVAMSACLGGMGEGGAVPSITVVSSGNAQTRGRLVSGQDGNGGLAPFGLAALRFDGLPGISVPALAGG